MAAYGVAHLHDVNVGPDIVEYLERIDATLKPYGGRFLIHGGTPQVVEGEWSGNLIVIEFPDAAHVRDWYDSPAYREILPLRTANARGPVFIIEGAGGDHKATDVLAR